MLWPKIDIQPEKTLHLKKVVNPPKNNLQSASEKYLSIKNGQFGEFLEFGRFGQIGQIGQIEQIEQNWQSG